MSTGPQSNLSAPAGFSASDEVFNDNFAGITLDKYWHPRIRAITPAAPLGARRQQRGEP
jgi:hypothetical protein